MRHSDLVDFESGRGEKCRQHRSVGEAFQRSSGSKDAEQDGAINFVRVLRYVKTAIGEAMVCRRTIAVSHSPNHKYNNIFHPKASLEILNANREIARAVGSDCILYIPDSAMPTSLLLDHVFEGWNVAEIIQKGISVYGSFPQDINRGRANYFFVDDLKQSLEGLQAYEKLPKYWRYDEKLKN